MNVTNLFNRNNTKLVKDTLLQGNDKQLFTAIFNKENKNLVVKKQNMLDRAVDNEYSKNTGSRRHENSVDISNKTFNNQAEVGNKGNSKLSSKKTEQLEMDENTNTEESVEYLEYDILNQIISLLQNLLRAITEDVSKVETESNIDIELSSHEIKGLADFKYQLDLLVDTINVESDQSLEESIKTTLAMLTKIIDETLFNDKHAVSIEKNAISEMLINIENLKNNVQTVLKNINLTENGNLKKLNMNKENDLAYLEEENLYKGNTTLSNTVNTTDEDNTKIGNLDKAVLMDNMENQNFFKQNDEQEYTVVNDNILASQQEKIDQTINVNVLKNEIVEPKQFINLISQKASAFLSKDRNEMTIQLTPEHLGKISIKIGLNDGTLTGKIYAENYSVKEIIEANLNQLRDALEENGLNITKLDVNVGDNTQNFGNGLFQQRIANRQKPKGVSMEINNSFITLEQDIDQRNPYLVSGQFDSLV